jgi:hypothetical protein
MMRCKVPGCEDETSKGGWGYCGRHYGRVKRTGTPGPSGYVRDPARTTAERIYPRLEQKGDCWIWTGARRNGYGAVGIGKKVAYVHRWVYEDMVGEIPDGLVLDHLCVERACANPSHVEPVTRAVNNERGGDSRGLRRGGRNAA